MTDREKLMGLVIEAKKIDPETRPFSDFLVDHLLANGVTIQRWIPVTEKLPEENGIYQIFGYDEDWEQTKVWYGQFSYYDWIVYDIYGNGKRFEVTHWMPLPEPPKEVE